MRWTRTVVRPGLGIVVTAALVRAQLNLTVPETCSDDLSWTFNERNQSACLVAAYLCDACRTDESVDTQETDCSIPSLQPGGQFYVNHKSPNDCDCNTVVYSLISACSLCQGAAVSSWSQWRANCNSSFAEQFPAPIPTNTSIPAWAYLDVVTSDNFNETIVGQIAKSENLPDSSAGSGPTSLSSTTAAASTVESSPPATSSQDSSPTGGAAIPAPTSLDSASGEVLGAPTSTLSLSATPIPGPSLHNSPPKTLVGPIVGGVVGGLGGLAIIVVLAFVLYHNHRLTHQRTRQEQYDCDSRALSWLSAGGGPAGPGGTLGNWGNGSRIYDPNDPSTFPPLIDPVTGPTQPSASHHDPSPLHANTTTSPRPHPTILPSQISRTPTTHSASLLSPGLAPGMSMVDSLPLHRTSSMHMMVTRPSDSRDRTPTSSIRAPSPQGAGVGQAYYYRGIPEV